jgi:DHA1 family bicyclomycin/chloramphenicol resistance-like MFS transporter
MKSETSLQNPIANDVASARRGLSYPLIALLVAMSGIGSLSLNILVPALPDIAARLETDPSNVQLTVSLYLVGLAFSQLLLGPLSDRFGRRPVILGGLALAALASFAAIFAGTITGLILARVVHALGASTGQVVGRAIIRDLYDRERAASVLGLVTSAMVVFPMLSPLIGGILDTLFGWESIFVFVAIVSFAVLAWAAATLSETRPGGAATSAPGQFLIDLRALTSSPRFIGYALMGALGSAPFYTFLGGGPYVVVTMMGRSSAEYGIWFAFSSIGFMAGNFTASRLTLRYGIDRMISAGILVTIAGALIPVVMCMIDPNIEPVAVFLPQTLISYGNGLLLPTALAGAVSIRPQVAGTASGITGFTQMAIGAVAVQIVSYAIAGATSPLPMLLLMLGFGVATGFGFVTLVRRA